MMSSGRRVKARSDSKGVLEKYLTVARFGQMLGPADWDFFLRGELQETYKRLGAIYEGEGNKVEAAFYTSLANQTDRAQHERLISLRNRVRGSGVSRWNSFLVKASGLVILFSGGLLLTCGNGAWKVLPVKCAPSQPPDSRVRLLRRNRRAALQRRSLRKLPSVRRN